jgi:excisionase family DNA binding protein
MDDLLTTKQLQDLLRVDRITIYRMLKDGRLRGFKVGGQWRFSRGEIEAWLQEQQSRAGWAPVPPRPEDGPLPFSQMLPLSCIRAIQAVCAEAMDIAMVTTDLKGAPLSGISNSSDFCSLILATELGQLRCSESWRRQPDGHVRSCHAGLLCASLPISVGGQVVAMTAACQFVAPSAKDDEMAWQSHLPDLAQSLSLHEADLQAVVCSVRIGTESQLSRVSEFLRRVAEAFSEIGQERLELLGRLEKISEMSRI